MEEIKAFALGVSFQVRLAKIFVFLVDFVQVFFTDLQICNISDDRFHRNRIHTLISDKQNVLRKIKIFRRERTAHVVALISTHGNEFLNLADDKIERTLAVGGFADCVVDFLSTVKGKHHVFHFRIEELNYLVRQQKSVGRRREQEFLARLCPFFLRISDRRFQYVEIHQGFAAEKVHFQDLSLTAVLNEEIDRFFRRFQAHTLTLGVVCALVGKAVAATEITIVANVDTKRLHFVAFHRVRFHFFLEKQALRFEPFHVGKNFSNLLVGQIGNIDGLSFFLGFQIVGSGGVAFV